MKLSVKLLFALAIVFCSLQIVNALYIRSYLNGHINGDNLGEGFAGKKVRPFKHIKVVASSENGGIVKIENGPEFQVKYFFQLENKVNFENKGDTLLVTLEEGYYDIENNKGAFPVVVSCPKFESVDVQNASIKFEDYNNPKIKINANHGLIRFEGELYIKELELELTDSSDLNFYVFKPYTLDKIVAKMSNASIISMPDVFPSEFYLKNTDDCKLELNGATLKLIKPLQ
jgi:hypothetical protein